MSSKPSWVYLTTDQQEELDRTVAGPGWRIVPQGELPSAFPGTFRHKIDSAVTIATPTSTGGTYLAYSANRVDDKGGDRHRTVGPDRSLDRRRLHRRVSAPRTLGRPHDTAASRLLDELARAGAITSRRG